MYLQLSLPLTVAHRRDLIQRATTRHWTDGFAKHERVGNLDRLVGAARHALRRRRVGSATANVTS
jgi:hypothetical protein